MSHSVHLHKVFSGIRLALLVAIQLKKASYYILWIGRKLKMPGKQASINNQLLLDSKKNCTMNEIKTKVDPEEKFRYHMTNLTLQKKTGLACWLGLVLIWIFLRLL